MIDLSEKTPAELCVFRDNVKVSNLTIAEKDEYLEEIASLLGEYTARDEQILQDIEDGSADIDDMGGY